MTRTFRAIAACVILPWVAHGAIAAVGGTATASGLSIDLHDLNISDALGASVHTSFFEGETRFVIQGPFTMNDDRAISTTNQQQSRAYDVPGLHAFTSYSFPRLIVGSSMQLDGPTGAFINDIAGANLFVEVLLSPFTSATFT